MKRRHWIFILLLILLIPSEATAQRWKLRRYEAYAGTGTVHPFMDIGRVEDSFRSFHLKGTRPNLTVGARYKIFSNLSGGLELSYIMFGGVDVDNHMTVHSFMTNSFEHTADFQFDIVSGGKALGTTALFNRRGMVNSYNSTDVYITFGVGGILSKAIAYDINGEIDRNDVYFNNNTNYGIVLPVGLGIKYSIDAYWSFGAEITGRFSFTDLLDGYATPYSNYQDRYILTSFRAVYKIRNDRKGRPIFSKYGR